MAKVVRHGLHAEDGAVHRVVALGEITERPFHQGHLSAHLLQLPLQEGNLPVPGAVGRALEHLVKQPHAARPDGQHERHAKPHKLENLPACELDFLHL